MSLVQELAEKYETLFTIRHANIVDLYVAAMNEVLELAAQEAESMIGNNSEDLFTRKSLLRAAAIRIRALKG